MEIDKDKVAVLRKSMAKVFIHRLMDSRGTRKMIVGQWMDSFSDEQLLEIVLDNYRADRFTTVNALKADGKCPNAVIDMIEELS